MTGWRLIGRVLLKAAILFALCNIIYVAAYPAHWIGNLSLYGTLYPSRERLPYGENPAQSYNVSTTNIQAMFAAHELSHAKSDDEFRVLLIGDSNTWGWLLENDQTLSAQLNTLDLQVEGRTVIVYNLGYPIMSLTKDLLILDQALKYDPDSIIWLISLASLPPEQQFEPPLVRDNLQRVTALAPVIDLTQYTDDTLLTPPALHERTIIGHRRALADLLRLQTYGIAWTATGVDQAIPDIITLRQSDFDTDVSWSIFAEPVTLTADDLAFDVLAAGIERAGEVPVIVVNEPMFISDGQNSDLRYNSFYPRWAYDQYRTLLDTIATENGWQYYDLWDTIAADEFTDSPVHLSAGGTRDFAQFMAGNILNTED